MISVAHIQQLSQQHPVLVYDGVCILCNGYVKWLLATDKRQQFRYVALQDAPEMKASLPAHDNDTVMLVHKGQRYTHSDVGLLIARQLGGLWSVLSIFLYLPKMFRDSVYRLIARHRYRWFGKSDTCILPDPKNQHLFLK